MQAARWNSELLRQAARAASDPALPGPPGSSRAELDRLLQDELDLLLSNRALEPRCLLHRPLPGAGHAAPRDREGQLRAAARDHSETRSRLRAVPFSIEKPGFAVKSLDHPRLGQQLRR